MIRWTLTALTLALLAIWLTSGLYTASCWLSVGSDRLGIGVIRGTICAVVADPSEAPLPGFHWRCEARYRLHWLPGRVSFSPGRFAHVPLWMLIAVSGALAAAAWRRHIRERRRRPADRRRNCGYDLHGLPAQQENSTAPPAPTSMPRMRRKRLLAHHSHRLRLRLKPRRPATTTTTARTRGPGSHLAARSATQPRFTDLAVGLAFASNTQADRTESRRSIPCLSEARGRPDGCPRH